MPTPWLQLTVTGITCAVGAGVAVFAAPLAVAAVGFGAGGVGAGTWAATMMSCLGTGAWSVVPVLQSVGATASVLGSAAATAITSGVGAAVGAVIGRRLN